MPYIITTRPVADPPNERVAVKGEIFSRRAVTTLAEAHDVIYDALRHADVYDEPVVGRVTEHGGTVGPLPDGTVIEVGLVGYFDLAEQIDVPKEPRSTTWGEIVMRPAPGVSDAEIIDAYNARQS